MGSISYYFRCLKLLLLLCIVPLWTFAQTITVKGVVKDEAGEAVIGASVVEKGTTNGIITDFDGNFELRVLSNATLTISFVGYQTQEIQVEGKTTINVVLYEDTKILDEVVVIGYGTARQSDVTGSIASIRGEKIREVPATNVTYALQSRIAGVEMSQTSSQPGSTTQIRIRGTRSLTASNDPLIVLDGIPFGGSLGDINPNDIKSIDILKDASSTAIYGSRGANGVILITTNKGIQESPAKFTYNGYAGIQTVFSQYPMMDGPTFAAMREYAGMYTNSLDESNDTNTNWQDLLYRNGFVNSHDIGVSGGTKGGNYSFGLGYYQNQGVIPTQKYTRYSMRGSFEQSLGKVLRFGLTTNSNYNITHGSQVGLYNVLSMSPLADPYNEDGSLKRTIQMPLDNTYVITRDVLESLEETYRNDNTAFGTYNNFFAEVNCPWVEGLKYRMNLGVNYRTSKTGAFTGEGVNSSTEDTPSTASLQHSETINWAVENLITYDRTFNDKHQLNVVGMFSAERTTYSSSYISARDIAAEYMQYYNLGNANGTITVDPDNWSYWQSGLISYMARAMYTYDNRYMLSATVRSDASSRLAKGHQWHTYPAVSVGWNISEESFMSDLKWLDQLKIRVGYGQTSNQAVDPYSTLGSLSTRPYNFGSTYGTGYYVSTLPNTELGWEYSSTWNFGLDFTLFRGRLSGTLEYYIQKTNDLLQSVTLPSTAGVGSYVANVGKTQNKGVEFTLNGTIIDNHNGWTWDASINIYANRNKITELASGQERDESNWWFVGYPIDVIYDYEKIGLWNETDADAQYLEILEPGGNFGMIKVKYTGDYNEDGSPTRAISSDDRQILDTNPKFQGGFSTRVAYKNFDLNIVGAFKYGGILISSLHGSSGYLNMLNGRRGNVDVDYWTETNTDAKYPKPGGITSNDSPKYGSTLAYFDASYWKVRTITLGYTFNQKWLRDMGADNLRAYFTVQNPFVICSPFHKETGMDPETNSYADENVATTSSLPSRLLTIGTNSPSTRTFLFGINLTF